jgi:hypothetical protein
MGESDWSHRLKQDMRRDEKDSGYYVGRFVDFLKQERRLMDTPEGLHQHVREIETYIRLHIRTYPSSPDTLIQQADRFYQADALKSVRAKLNNAYRRFYAAYCESI